MKLNIIIEKGEDACFVAHCPALRSCWTQGRTEDEALRNIKEAINLYLECGEELVRAKLSFTHGMR